MHKYNITYINKIKQNQVAFNHQKTKTLKTNNLQNKSNNSKQIKQKINLVYLSTGIVYL
jgi:hypothetical protein